MKLEIIEKRKLGEVFTPEYLVNYMLDKFELKAWEENKTFLEPSAGNGNMVLAILKRKIEVYHHDPLKALSTVYAIELMPDNVSEMKERILNYILQFSNDINEIKKIIDKNIVCANSLNYDFSFSDSKEKKGLLRSKMFKLKKRY